VIIARLNKLVRGDMGGSSFGVFAATHDDWLYNRETFDALLAFKNSLNKSANEEDRMCLQNWSAYVIGKNMKQYVEEYIAEKQKASKSKLDVLRLEAYKERLGKNLKDVFSYAWLKTVYISAYSHQLVRHTGASPTCHQGNQVCRGLGSIHVGDFWDFATHENGACKLTRTFFHRMYWYP
jgi:hypothetical protein